MLKKSGLVFIILIASLCLATHSVADSKGDGLYADMETTKGKILFRLFYEKVPMTVANFVGLAEGKMTWRDPVTYEIKDVPFYDGLPFHGVVPGIMIQGGDPEGNGHGGPGYHFQHEFHPDLKHRGPGTLSMLNDGPYTHGSQFLITLEAAPFLDKKHVVFGKAVEGLDIVQRLQKGDRIIRVRILRIGDKATAFDLTRYLNLVRHSAQGMTIIQRGPKRAPGAKSPQ